MIFVIPGTTWRRGPGATTRELMHRMGHGSVRAAMIYQHATSERDREIAERLSTLVQVDAPRGGAKNVDEFRPPAGGSSLMAR
jgi:hypothetical protein